MKNKLPMPAAYPPPNLKPLFGAMRQYLWILVLSLLICPLSKASAISIGNQTVTNTTIPYETLEPHGTTIQFTIDFPAEIHVDVRDSVSGNNVTTIDQNYDTAGAKNLYWQAYWLLGTQGGRKDGYYQLTLTATDSLTGDTNTKSINLLVGITSIDIHNLTAHSSFDSTGNAGPPFAISYLLAKSGMVTTTVIDSSNTVVRTLVSNKLQVDETISSNTVVWDGTTDSGHPAPLGLYTVLVDATDPATGDRAITKSLPLAITTLSGSLGDPIATFKTGVFVFPNPVRAGLATIQFTTVRDGATVFLKIYTLSGDLVLNKIFSGLSAGTITQFPWNALNDAGNKVGRGLYYYEVREEDPVSTIQIIKKIAVIQ